MTFAVRNRYLMIFFALLCAVMLGWSIQPVLAHESAVPLADDLSVTKSGPAYVVGSMGEEIVYDVTVVNSSTVTVTNILFTDTLPANTSYVMDDSGITPSNVAPGVYVWPLSDMPAMMTTTFQIVVSLNTTPTSGMAYTNTVNISSDLAGDDPSTNMGTAVTVAYPLVTIPDIQMVADPATDDASPLDGQTVWVEGIVTSAPGEIDTSSGRTRYMVIEEPAGGAWSGLVAYRNSDFGMVAVEGDHVRLLGTVDEFFGLTELSLSGAPWSVEVLSSGNPVPGPDVIATGDFATAATAEQWEGVFIEFQNATVTNEDIGFGEWNFDDSSGDTRADDMGTADGNWSYVPANGDTYNYIRGIGYYSFSNYKLQPRRNSDVDLQASEPHIEKSAPATVSAGNLFTYTITVDNDFSFDLTDVVITDQVPANSTFAYALDGGSEAAGVVSWNIANLPAFSSASVHFAVTATTTSNVLITNDQYEVTASNFTTPTMGMPLSTVIGEINIHHLQGAGHISPFNGSRVPGIDGIVTVVVGNGFYLQEADANVDASDDTAEAIFVFTGGAPTVAVGDMIVLDGNVSEFYPGGMGSGNLSTTQLSNVSITILSSGNPLPAPIDLGNGGRMAPNMVIDNDSTGDVNMTPTFDPSEDGIDFYESLEGMLVRIDDAHVVGSNRFGEVQVVADFGANASTVNARGSLPISMADYNPERLIIDDEIIWDEPDFTVGDRFASSIEGVVGYTFGNYKIFNYAPLPAIVPGGLLSETTTLVGDADHLTVASLNVENLDPSDDAAKFAGLADQIVNYLMSPDILSLQEVQDNNGATDDGTTDAGMTYDALIMAIQAAGGPVYEYRDIAPVDNQDGGEPGGNIRVGFLFRPDRVEFVDRGSSTATDATSPVMGALGVELTLSPGRINPTNAAFTDSRKSIVGEFRFNDNTVFVVGNHLNSKGGDNPLFGRVQPPVLSSEVSRVEKANIINSFVDSILALDDTAHVVVLGDMNDFQFSPPLQALMGGDMALTNLVETLPAGDQYTYIYDGNAQALDHLLVTQALVTTGAAEFDIVHTNAEFDSDFRHTDHDPLISRFYLPVAPTSVSLSQFDGATGSGSWAWLLLLLPAFLIGWRFVTRRNQVA